MINLCISQVVSFLEVPVVQEILNDSKTNKWKVRDYCYKDRHKLRHVIFMRLDFIVAVLQLHGFPQHYIDLIAYFISLSRLLYIGLQ